MELYSKKPIHLENLSCNPFRLTISDKNGSEWNQFGETICRLPDEAVQITGQARFVCIHKGGEPLYTLVSQGFYVLVAMQFIFDTPQPMGRGFKIPPDCLKHTGWEKMHMNINHICFMEPSHLKGEDREGVNQHSHKSLRPIGQIPLPFLPSLSQ